MELHELLQYALDRKASDLHLSADMVPWLRIEGELQETEIPAIASKRLEEILLSSMDEQATKQFTEKSEVDFAYELKGKGRFRVNIFRQRQGIAAAFRLIPEQLSTLAELGLPSKLTELVMLPRGLILVTGPTGSGKTTTLAAMVDYINERRDAHIITIEDPIEFIHSNKKSLVQQRELMRDTTSFSSALRAALREDPDVILVGEMRDLETMRLALTAAETGHLVFATLHTISAIKSISRIVEVFPGDERALVRTVLADSLQAVLSQVLVPKINAGSRIAATELMICNPAIRNLIRENKLEQAYSVLQTGSQIGMYTLEQNLQQLVQEGVVAEEVAASLM